VLAALDVPLIVYALGDNRFPGQPDFDELMRTHVGQVLDQSVFFGLRNTGSMSTMSALLGVRDRIVYQPCPTTILDHLYAPLEGRRPDPTERTVAIQMLVHARQIAAGFDAETIHEATVRAARILVGTGWRVLSTRFHPDDAEVSRRLIAEVPGVEEVRLYGHDVGFFSGIELFTSVPYVLGGRGHAQMIPFGVGSIPISVGLHAKLGYFASDIGHPEFVVPVGPEGMSNGESGGDIDPAEAAASDASTRADRSAESRVQAAETLAERMVSALEDAYASGKQLQADLADTRARFAEITAENLAAIHDSLASRGDTRSHGGAGWQGVGRVQSFARSAGDSPSQEVGDPLRTGDDVRAEEFHVAAVSESEEVASQQSRALARACRDKEQERRDHRQAIAEAKRAAATRVRTVETERDEARADAHELRREVSGLERRVETLTSEVAGEREALAKERNRSAVDEAKVLSGKLRHGVWWRFRRLVRTVRRFRS
jgi:hypothetical protein